MGETEESKHHRTFFAQVPRVLFQGELDKCQDVNKNTKEIIEFRLTFHRLTLLKYIFSLLDVFS